MRTVKNRNNQKPKSKKFDTIIKISEYVLMGVIIGMIACLITYFNIGTADSKVRKAEASHVHLNVLNTVILRGAFSDQSVIKAQHGLYNLSVKRAKSNYPIYLVLDSPGGSISAGMDLINYANQVGNVHTITYDGASMAAVTAQLVTGKRYVLSNSTMMFHRASIGGLSGQLNEGEVESRLRYLKAMITNITTRVASRLGLTFDELQQKQKDEYWLYGSDIVDAKAADSVITVSCSKALTDKKEIITVRQFIFVQELTFSGCPSFRSPL